jgi:glycosyltransferase involved in cell wall biosynthesis
MNILHVIRTMDPAWGGPVEGLKNIARQAAALGHWLEITCLDAPESPWLKRLDCNVNAIGAGTLGRYGYASSLDTWLAGNIARFDVVIANGIWMYFSSAVRRAALRSRTPYFVFAHGALDPWFKRHYPLKHIKKQVYWSLVERKVLRDATAVLFTTAEELALAQNAFWPYRCNSKVVGYGIADPHLSNGRSKEQFETPDPMRRAFPALGDRPFLLFLARIHEKKGIDLLLQAIARNISSYQDRAVVIAGPGKDSYVAELKSMSMQLGLERQLIWTGPLYGKMKWAALREAEAYVLPSHQENFGISVAEALACGVPALVTNKVNIWREIVSEGGGLAENDDVSGICRLLDKWSRLRSEQRTSMRERARRCFLNHFDIARTSSNLFDMFARQRTTQPRGATLECAS